jgi:antitoxin ParD1/3/4
MTKNTSISLGDHFSNFVDQQLAQGRYSSASEVVRAGLRLLEEQEMRLEALRSALIEGEQNGPSERFDFDSFLEEQHKSTDVMGPGQGKSPV